MRLLRVKQIYPTESEQMKAHYRKALSTEVKSRNQERETKQCSNATQAFSPACTMCYDWPQSDFIVTSLQLRSTTSFHSHCPTGQIPPFSSVAYIFCPTDVQFPSDCPEAHVQHTWRAMHVAVCLSLFAAYCFHTFLCDLQTSLASEFCCKFGPPSWTLWHL